MVYPLNPYSHAKIAKNRQDRQEAETWPKASSLREAINIPASVSRKGEAHSPRLILRVLGAPWRSWRELQGGQSPRLPSHAWEAWRALQSAFGLHKAGRWEPDPGIRREEGSIQDCLPLRSVGDLHSRARGASEPASPGSPTLRSGQIERSRDEAAGARQAGDRL